MKNVNLQIEVETKPEVIWRLKLFMAIMRFAVWVGGFGSVEFDIPERTEQSVQRTGCTCPLIDDHTMGINPDCVVHGELASR